jgi:hypothetical protein
MNDTPDLFGVAEREAGIRRTATANGLWLAAARDHVARIALHHAVTADDVRAWADDKQYYPASPAAWGAIFKSCPLPGTEWQFYGFTRSRVKSNHARRIVRWILVPANPNTI